MIIKLLTLQLGRMKEKLCSETVINENDKEIP